MVGSSATKNKQNTMARIGTNGTRGVLNGRFRSGLCLRRTITDADTIINAASVPMFTSSAISVMGKKAEINPATIPTSIMLFMGVLNLV